jgi:hypothetical protein
LDNATAECLERSHSGGKDWRGSGCENEHTFMIHRLQTEYEIYGAIIFMIATAIQISPSGLRRRYRWEGRDGESLDDYLLRPSVSALNPGGKVMIGSLALFVLLKLLMPFEIPIFPGIFLPIFVGMIAHLAFTYKAWRDSRLSK